MSTQSPIRLHCRSDRDVVATSYLRLLPGGTRSVLLLDEFNKPWLVKFLDNPQHRRVLINEYVAGRLCAHLGLTMPRVSCIEVSDDLASDIRKHFPDGVFYVSGVHLGIQYAGGLFPDLVVGLRDLGTDDVLNRGELAGIYVADVWLNNADERQVIFTREMRRRQRRAVWVDQGFCFGGVGWNLNQAMPRGYPYKYLAARLYPNLVDDVVGWIRRIQSLSLMVFHGALQGLPADWCAGDENNLVELMAKLLDRQHQLESLVRESVAVDFGAAI